MLWELDTYLRTFSTIPAFRKLIGEIKYYPEKKLSFRIPHGSHLFQTGYTKAATSYRWLLFWFCWYLCSGAWKKSRRIEKLFEDLMTKYGATRHREGRFQNSITTHRCRPCTTESLSSFHTCPINKLHTLSMRPCLLLLSLLLFFQK